MFITKLGNKAIKAFQTLVHSRKAATSVVKQAENLSGLAIKTLEKDSLEIAQKTAQAVTKPVAKTAAAPVEPFCQQFWKSIDLKPYRCRYGRVTYHGHLNGINHHLTTHTNPEGLTQVFFGAGITPKEMIIITDAEFKALPKTTETIRAFRCIGEKPEFFEQEYARYMKSLGVKKGEIIRMPEYAYSSIDINFAKNFLYGTKGIIYDIEIPVGSRVSLSGCDIVFPRSSRFECLGKEVKDGITNIRLRYIQPPDYMA